MRSRWRSRSIRVTFNVDVVPDFYLVGRCILRFGPVHAVGPGIETAAQRGVRPHSPGTSPFNSPRLRGCEPARGRRSDPDVARPCGTLIGVPVAGTLREHEPAVRRTTLRTHEDRGNLVELGNLAAGGRPGPGLGRGPMEFLGSLPSLQGSVFYFGSCIAAQGHGDETGCRDTTVHSPKGMEGIVQPPGILACMCTCTRMPSRTCARKTLGTIICSCTSSCGVIVLPYD